MIRIAAFATALVPASAAAHPGHGAGLHGHGEEIAAVAAICAVAGLVLLVRRAR